MLTVMETIQQRRSIRKFKADPVSDELITQMLEAARLAPSGTNRQPWRFQVIKDQNLKEQIFNEASFGGKPLLEAPVIIACGSELLTFVKGHKLAQPGCTTFGVQRLDIVLDSSYNLHQAYPPLFIVGERMNEAHHQR